MRQALWAMVWAMVCALMFSATAAAHETPVIVTLERSAARLEARARTPANIPIRGMRLGLVAVNSSSRQALTLTERADGVYGASVATLRDGEYQFTLTDSTPGFSPVTAQTTVAWREGVRFEILLPPSPPTPQDTSIMLALIVAPVVLSLGVVGFIALGRPKASVSS